MIFHQIVFLLLLFVSLWMFSLTIFERFTKVDIKENKLKTTNILKRIKRIFLEVVLQWRVIRDRPIVGIMHALVMWGFFVFSWVTIEHVIIGLVSPENIIKTEYGWYDTFAACWAIMVMIGITSLSFRRFVLRPKYLGKLSLTSALVAVLIMVLMATYLFGWSGWTKNGLAVYVNWWLHTISLFLMLVVIPKSKHLHLVFAPLAIFLRSETTSKLRPLDIENEDLGMISFTDLSLKDVLDLNVCVECGRCTEACPVNNAGGSLSPKAIILGMQKGYLSSGNIIAGNNEEVSQQKAWVKEEDLFQCLSCGACEVVCPVGIEHVGAKILDLRRGLASEGRIENEKVLKLYSTMEKTPHSPWGAQQDTRRKFVEKEKFQIFDGSQEWLFWLGCGLSYDPHGQKVAVAMKKILEAGNISWGVFENETCCGEPARRTGNEGLFLELSQKLIDKFKQNKVKKIISCCPHCVTMLDNDYRQASEYESLGIKIVHHSEFLEKITSSLKLKPESGEVTYHDPCYLARGRDVTSEPRVVLKSCGLDVKEMEHFGQNTFCCGAGGGQIFIADDKNENNKERVNHLRFKEVEKTRVNTVAVACPYCPIMLQDAANHAERTDIQILDIAEIVANRLISSQKQEEAAMRDGATWNGAEERVTVLIGDVSFHYHPNGGGLVADTASVAETVHVAPRAMVFGEAQLRDKVQVTGRARVGGTVKASEGVIFGGSVFITEGTFKGFNKIIHQK